MFNCNLRFGCEGLFYTSIYLVKHYLSYFCEDVLDELTAKYIH